MKKLLSLLLCALMLLSLSACAEADPAAGDYLLLSVSGTQDVPMFVNLETSSVSLSLSKNGKAALTSGETVTDGTWSRTDAQALSIRLDDAVYDAALHNDILILTNTKDNNLAFAMRRVFADSAANRLPATSLTLESAIGSSLGTEDFVSPTKKLREGMRLYGVMRLSDIVRDGKAEEGAMLVDVWGFIETDAEGNPFIEVYSDPNFEGKDPIFSTYIKLYDDRIVPVIGHQDAWMGRMYLTQEDVKHYSARLENGALNFTAPYQDDTGLSCTLDLILREKGAEWDTLGDRFAPTGVTAADIEAALQAEAETAP